ncbi:MAG: SGNH hydrolase domain-containing protein [Arthrobacter sp.]
MLPEAGPPLYAPVPEPYPGPVENGYTEPEKIRPKAPAGMRQKIAYSSLAVLAAASVVVTGLAMAPRTPPPPSGAAEAYLENREQEPGSEPEATPEPTLLSILETELTAALAATAWPGPLEAGEADPELEAVLDEASTGCTAEPSGARSCSLPPGDMSRTAAVVGDASAAGWVPALRRYLEPKGWRVLSLAQLDCSLPLQAAAAASAGDECALHAEAVARVIADDAPGLVFVSNTRPTDSEGQWEEGLRVLYGQWLSPAGQVIALGPVPQVQDAIACQEAGRAPADCTVTLDPAWIEASAGERSAAEAAAAAFLDPAAWFCAPDGRCPAFAGGRPMQQDGALTPAYAARLGPVLGEAVLTILAG